MTKTLPKAKQPKRTVKPVVSYKIMPPKATAFVIEASPAIAAKSLYKLAHQEALKPKPDYTYAADLLVEAAHLRNSDAVYALATWYLFGRGPIKKDFRQAVRLLIVAVRLGNKDAMYDLAVSYEKGNGVSKDARQAFTLYRKAARRGDKKAIFEVGRCLYYGIGVEQNRRAAAYWFDKADKLGSYEPLDNGAVTQKSK